MKIKIVIAILLFSSSLKSQEGWVTQQGPSSVHELYDVYAINSAIAFAVGDSCKIIKTTDGGENWRYVYLSDSKTQYLYSIFFSDSLHGWAVGGVWWEKSTILKTDDCGETWYEQTCDAIVPLYAVFFVDAYIGWIAGDSGTILKTIDGGNTWMKKESGTQYNTLKDIYFFNSNNGYIVGKDGGWGHVKYGVILKTSDGGETWTHQTSDNLNSMCFLDEKNGWIIGVPYENYPPNVRSVLYFTNNGGDAWETITINGYALNSLFFVDTNKGWAVGNNIILNTIDSGKTWTKQFQKDGYSDYLHSIFFVDKNTGWAIGFQGASSIGRLGSILKTNNGGLSNIVNPEITNPKKFCLFQNYPNPFNSTTDINFDLSKTSKVTLMIYDVFGREVETLSEGVFSVGRHKVSWSVNNIPSGLYFYKIETEDFVEVRKMILQK